MNDAFDRDSVLPVGKWQFDGEVARVFDNMLQRSIPQYDQMRALVNSIAHAFVSQTVNPTVVDLGCSRGEALAPLVASFGTQCHYVGVEVSEPMLEAVRTRFESNETVQIRSIDLRTDYPDVQATVTLAVLTLQFIPIEYRQTVLQKVYEHTTPGGCVILVEKVLGSTAVLNELMVQMYLDMKRQNGYSQEQIDRKRLALEGVLVPVTERWNREMLQASGFDQVDCIWRWMNFAGWLGIRSS
jgi:tRNA (cmo5U34)-methyltransferase